VNDEASACTFNYNVRLAIGCVLLTENMRDQACQVAMSDLRQTVLISAAQTFVPKLLNGARTKVGLLAKLRVRSDDINVIAFGFPSSISELDLRKFQDLSLRRRAYPPHIV
jgi:hypothetical protein